MKHAVEWDTLSAEALFALARKRLGRRGYWDVIAELHKRGSREIFNFAVSCCGDADPRVRAMGADILGQLGWSKDRFRRASIQQLLKLMDDSDHHVVQSACCAAGHRRASEAVPRLVELAKSRRSLTRFYVVQGLLCQESDAAVQTMIVLSRDRDAGVRDWATFGLAEMIDRDDAAISAALTERLGDSELEVRSEALNGLARLKHPQAATWIAAELANDDVITGVFEAAIKLADPILMPALLALRERWPITEDSDTYFYRVLDDAIAACTPAVT